MLRKRSLDGLVPPIVHYRGDPGDTARRADVTRLYREVVAGRRPPGDMPDFRDIYTDTVRAELNFLPQPGASGRAVLRRRPPSSF